MRPKDVYELDPAEYRALWRYRDEQVRAHNRAVRRRK